MKNNESVWGPVHRDGIYALSEIVLLVGLVLGLFVVGLVIGLAQIYWARRFYDAGHRKAATITNAGSGLIFVLLGVWTWL